MLSGYHRLNISSNLKEMKDFGNGLCSLSAGEVEVANRRVAGEKYCQAVPKALVVITTAQAGRVKRATPPETGTLVALQLPVSTQRKQIQKKKKKKTGMNNTSAGHVSAIKIYTFYTNFEDGHYVP